MKKYNVYWTEESTWKYPVTVEAEDKDEAQDKVFGGELSDPPKQVDSRVIEVFVEEIE